jgi:hypothetical protein
MDKRSFIFEVQMCCLFQTTFQAQECAVFILTKVYISFVGLTQAIFEAEELEYMSNETLLLLSQTTRRQFPQS